MVTVKTTREDDLFFFLENHGFEVTEIESDVHRIVREDCAPVYVSRIDSELFFQVDLGSLKGIGSEKLYLHLLKSNTDILPVSFAVDTSNEEDPRLLLVESREIGDLNDKEVLSVFDALSLAEDKAEMILNGLV
jgi:hypothetical protein